jgi:hypothetical protein
MADDDAAARKRAAVAKRKAAKALKEGKPVEPAPAPAAPAEEHGDGGFEQRKSTRGRMISKVDLLPPGTPGSKMWCPDEVSVE